LKFLCTEFASVVSITHAVEQANSAECYSQCRSTVPAPSSCCDGWHAAHGTSASRTW